MWYIQVEAEKIGNTEKRVCRVRLLHESDDAPPTNPDIIKGLLLDAIKAIPWDMKRLSVITLGPNMGRRKTDEQTSSAS